MKKCNILENDIAVTNMEETIEFIKDNLENMKGDYICISNVHTTIMAYENCKYRKIQNSSIVSLPDGGPLVTFSKIVGFKEAQRVTGPDLMSEIFKISKENRYKHFFYGDTEETLLKLQKELKKKYGEIEIVGLYSPPFRELTEIEDKEIINKINEVNPDFIWVGLGAPKQEIWMNNHRGKIKSLMIGVGAGFNYHAGNLKRAPKWMQKYNLEWLFRLFQDPKKLFKRYLVTNSKFLYVSAKKIIERKLYEAE